MLHKPSLFALIIFLFGPPQALAADYFVRPFISGGVYGSGTGLSYQDAWNGMSELDAKWGDPIGSGDIVYICGVHSSGRPGLGWLRPSASGAEGAPIVIDGNCPDEVGGIDKGTIFGVHVELSRNGWGEPDENGIYSRSYGGSTGSFLLEDFSRLNWIPPDENNDPTLPFDQWPPGSFMQAGGGGTLHYKPSSGVASDHTIHTSHSELVIFSNQSHLHFKNLVLYGAHTRVFNVVNGDFIRIEGNDIQWALMWFFNDSDDGVITGNEIHDFHGSGILMYTPGTGSGQQVNLQSNDRWTISHNHIYNISPFCLYCGSGGGGDRHGIGYQGGNNIIIEYNHMHDIGGEGIVFYNWSNNEDPPGSGNRIGQNQRDNIIRYNFIHDVKDLRSNCTDGSPGSGEVKCSSERGIILGSDSQPVIPETVTGNVVHHNVLANIDKLAFRFKATKPETGHSWRILNNVVYNSGTGFELLVNAPESEILTGAEYRNNVFLNPTNLHLDLRTSTLPSQDARDLINNNIYYPDGPLFRTYETDFNPDQETYYDFAGWQALLGHDVNSAAADPVLADPTAGDFHWAGVPSVLAGLGDFSLVANSPAIDAGAGVGLTIGHDGNPVIGAVDIGAYEFGTRSVSEAVTYGSVGGTHADTHISDDSYEAIQETPIGGSGKSRLLHTWTLDATGGRTGTLVVGVEAHHTANTESDDFIFAYSPDGSTFTDMLTVTKTVDDNTAQTFTLPLGTDGTLYIRVRDADQSSKAGVLDTVFVDQLYVGVE